jgi:lysozyme family protein|tara:strand:- start:677 stop:1312 length:636 start_codon:yes stop_codon:yes gene_type:complete
MKQNADRAIRRILKHEGGYVNHPRDPGGATNRGVTIGTLRSLGMDLDGDGDVDVTDLKRLTEADAVKVYKRFYWDKVEADFLPAGVDYAVADFAVNSGPSRAAKYLQNVLGVKADGDIGPVTIAAAQKASPVLTINLLCDDRLAFLKRLSTWDTFGRGWSSRVAGVRRDATADAKSSPVEAPPAPPATEIPGKPSIWSAIVAALQSIFGRK